MKLLDLHENLYYGELSNLITTPTLFPGKLPDTLMWKVGSYLNQALTQIYTRFVLLEKEVVINAYDNIYLYYLQKIYALTDPTVVAVKYIQDTVDDPFLEDIIRIEQVLDELGRDVPVNETFTADEIVNPGANSYWADGSGFFTQPTNPLDNKLLSVFTPKYDCLQIPAPVTGATYTILYQASHPLIVPTDLTSQIMLPSSLEMPLRAYICYLLYSGMNGDNVARGAAYLQTFEQLCAQVLDKDLVRTSNPDLGNKFLGRGFV